MDKVETNRFVRTNTKITQESSEAETNPEYEDFYEEIEHLIRQENIQ